jgi:hypothetical protein
MDRPCQANISAAKRFPTTSFRSAQGASTNGEFSGYGFRTCRFAAIRNDDYTCRSTIMRLMSAMAFAGLRCFGQAFAQFMMVWQR